MAFTLMDLVAKLSMDSTDYEDKMNRAPSFAEGAGKLISTAIKTWVGVKAVGYLKNFAQQSVETGMQFDKAMSQVAATMGKTVDEIQDLRDFAQEMGRTTAFSATEAAEALNYMALAGYDAETSMKMLPNVLNLAAAGSFDLARASDMITDTQTAFGISLERTTQMVDEMAKAASTGNTSVEQLGDAFLTVGGLAKELNGGMVTLADGSTATVDGVQELEIALTAMANAGVKGSEAGTHMRNMLLKLTAPGNEGIEMFQKLGVSVLDSEGNMKSLNTIFTDLNDSLGKLSQGDKLKAISEIFNARDTASAEALLAAVGQDWDHIGEAILNAQGAAEQMAKTQLDNLAGDTTLFKSALEGAEIAISDRLSPSLRGFVQNGTKWISALTAGFSKRGFEGALLAFRALVQHGVTDAISNLPEATDAGIKLVTNIVSGMMSVGSILMDAGGRLVTAIGEGFVTGFPTFLGTALPKVLEFTTSLRERASDFVDTGLQFILNLAQGLINSLPVLISYVPQIVENIAGIINDNMPKIIATGLQILVNLGVGIINALPALLANIGNIISSVVSVFMAFNWLNLGSKLLTLVTNGFKAIANAPVEAIRNIGRNIFNTFKNGLSWSQLGRDIINGIVSGIRSIGHAIGDTLLGFASEAFNAAKNFFRIGSPSKLMRDKIGRWIPEGIAVGIEQNADSAIKAMDDLNEATLGDINLQQEVNRGEGVSGESHAAITMNIYGAEGQDVQELADIVADKLKKALNGKEAVYA